MEEVHVEGEGGLARPAPVEARVVAQDDVLAPGSDGRQGEHRELQSLACTQYAGSGGVKRRAVRAHMLLKVTKHTSSAYTFKGRWYGTIRCTCSRIE